MDVTEAERLAGLPDAELAVTPLFRRFSRRRAGRKMRVHLFSTRDRSLGEFIAARQKWERGLDGWLDHDRAENLDGLRQALAKFIERELNPVTEPDDASGSAQALRPVTREQVRASWKLGGTCGVCARMLEPDEPVTVVLYRLDGTVLNAVVCDGCVELKGGYWPKQRLLGIEDHSYAYSRIRRGTAPEGWDLPLHTWTGRDGVEHSYPDWHGFERDELQHLIPFASCEGCGRPTRTARRSTRTVGARTIRRKRWDPQPGESKYVKLDEPVYEWFTACSKRCVTDVRRPARATAGPATCNTCGEPFDAVRPDARYCSSACRQKAYRERKR